MNYRAELESLCSQLIAIEEREWKPVQVFRSDDQVAKDEIRHEMASEIADIARAVLASMTDEEPAP